MDFYDLCLFSWFYLYGFVFSNLMNLICIRPCKAFFDAYGEDLYQGIKVPKGLQWLLKGFQPPQRLRACRDN